MDQCFGAAAKLPESERKNLAILALARSQTISELATRHEVSRKFIYQQAHKAHVALDEAFSPATPEDGVLFQFTVTKAWLRQVIVALPLMCHSSYRGVIEFLRDLLGIPISLGTVHDVLQLAARQAELINAGEDLSGIRVGLHDEIFQGGTVAPRQGRQIATPEAGGQDRPGRPGGPDGEWATSCSSPSRSKRKRSGWRATSAGSPSG
jgi:hypothetical protein